VSFGESIMNLKSSFDLNRNIAIKSISLLENANLRIEGNGILQISNIDIPFKVPQSNNRLVFAGNITLRNNLQTNKIRLSFINVEFQNCSRFIQDSGVSLIIQDANIVLPDYSHKFCDNTNLNSAIFTPLHENRTLVLERSYSLLLNNIQLTRSSISSPYLAINARLLTLTSNSSISSDGLGHAGGFGNPFNFLPGSGPGSGSQDGFGGCGGGNFGLGALGLGGVHTIKSLEKMVNTGFDSTEFTTNPNIQYGRRYGSYKHPIDPGSGGGGAPFVDGTGGNGGGVIVLMILNDITIDKYSSISANAESSFNG